MRRSLRREIESVSERQSLSAHPAAERLLATVHPIEITFAFFALDLPDTISLNLV
jgi:hypothetical protein